MLRLLFGTLETASWLTGWLTVLGPATLITTLPDTTVHFPVASLLVALHAGPLSDAPPEAVTFGAFLDGFVTTIDEGRGVLTMALWAAWTLPIPGVIGAWFRRDTLVREAARGAERPRARP